MRFVDEFSSSYVVDVDPGWPGMGEDVARFQVYDKLNMHSGEFCDIRFYLNAGGSWVGQFELGKVEGNENSVFTTPINSQACVIACGAGYWVDVEQRCVTQIECLPITQALVAAKQSSIIIVTSRDLYAHSSSKALWSLCDIADDRLKIERIEQDTLTAVGFVLGGMMEIRVDLLTGQEL